ncbi:MAG TPA: tyrosine-type recombinase/integrase, partial [Planctomycetaceae bacterium]|nr:tyrosine-type recombinase/integrase [Planctomycetaceae bacterium]
MLNFLEWCERRNRQLQQVSPADVGIYLDELSLCIASKKQVLAGLRHFFDGMVTRHAISLNPALSVRGERYQVVEGKTPEITIKQARTLLASIDTETVVGFRDKAIISILVYTASRIGAVATLKVKDLYDVGDQYCLHFLDKGGKSREIPVRHDLQGLLRSYLQSVGCNLGDATDRPLFRTAIRKTNTLSVRPMSAGDIGRMRSRMNGKAWAELSAQEHRRFPGDYEAQVSQGPIAAHSAEHLRTSDRGIALLRRLLRLQLQVVAAGGDPVGIVRDPQQ